MYKFVCLIEHGMYLCVVLLELLLLFTGLSTSSAVLQSVSRHASPPSDTTQPLQTAGRTIPYCEVPTTHARPTTCNATANAAAPSVNTRSARHERPLPNQCKLWGRPPPVLHSRAGGLRPPDPHPTRDFTTMLLSRVL